MKWRIRRKTNDKRGRNYYSHEFGWTWPDFADIYAEGEKDAAYLPPDGVWEDMEE